MVDLDNAVIARLKKGENVFEVFVDCDKAMAFREGKVGLSEALVAEEIFSDAKQGERASEHVMQQVFGTTNPLEIAEKIIKEGEVQLTAEYKNKIREQKRKQIIQIIHRNGINPQTGLPHPPQRIELAMDEAKVNIDEFGSAEEQVPSILSRIKEIIPIKFEIREIAVKIPPKYAAQAFGHVKKLGKVLRDDWQSDGSLVLVLEIPAGTQETLENELSKLTHGEIELKILNKR